MNNLKAALAAANLKHSCYLISSSSFLTVLGTSFRLSLTEISPEIVKFLEEYNYRLYFNVYPSFSYSADPETVHLEYYALFSICGCEEGMFEYRNRSGSMVDAVNWALKDAGDPNVDLVV